MVQYIIVTLLIHVRELNVFGLENGAKIVRPYKNYQ